MYYMLTPLHLHVDFGFGATGDAFKEAADQLEAGLPDQRRGVLNEQLPINYLRRHAIELFLKSAIVIIHKRLRVPYGEHPSSGQPYALVDGKWVPFQRLHSIKRLWKYLSFLFTEHKSFFDSIERVDWSWSPDVDALVDEIEARDPRSTFFRYPDPLDPTKDTAKSAMARGSPGEIAAQIAASEPDTPKQLILLMENAKGEVEHGYYYVGDALASLSDCLKKCVEEFNGTHAALRWEVCGGA